MPVSALSPSPAPTALPCSGAPQVFFQHDESGERVEALAAPEEKEGEERGDDDGACEELGADGTVYQLDAPGGRRLRPGWRRFIDVAGNVWYEHDTTGEAQWDAPLLLDECVAVDIHGNVWQLDAPGGRRLKAGWRRCEDATDVWYESASGESRWDAPLA